MNKKITKLMAAIALLAVFALPGKAWADSVTFDFTNNDNYTINTTNKTITYGQVATFSYTVTGTDNCQKQGGIQWGSSSKDAGTITITTSAYNTYVITRVDIQATSTAGYNAAVSVGSTSYTGASTNSAFSSTSHTNTYTGSSSGNLQIVLSQSSTKKNVIVQKITITYTTSGGGDTPTTYTVTYNANDGSANPATFTDNNGGEGYESGATVTIMDNNINSNDNPSFSKTGYTFAAWSDMQDGTDNEANLYYPDDNQSNTFNITESTTLYAQWNINKYHVALSSVDDVTLTATYGTNSTIAESENPEIDYNTEITLNAAGLATGKVFVWDVYKTGESATKVTVTNGKFNVPAFDVTITGSVVDLDYSNTYTSGNGLLSTTGGTNASTCKVAISNVEYDGIKAGTGSNYGAWQVTVPANTNKLHLHLAAWNGESVTLVVTPSDYSSNISLTANSGIAGSGSTYTWGSGNNDKDPSSSNHYKVITFDEPLENNVTLTFTASSSYTGKRFVVWGVNTEATTEPYITAADVDIASNATLGSITYTVHNTPNPAGTLTAEVTTGGDWLTLGVVGANVPFTCSANPNTVERTATVTLTYTYGDNKTTSETVTVTQAPLVVTYTYSLATSIESGKHYLITSGTTDDVYAMGHDKGNNRNAKSVTIDNNGKISLNSDVINTENNVFEFVINGPEMITKNNQQVAVYTIYDVASTGYLYAASSGNNYLKKQVFNDNNGCWSISISNNVATIIAQGSNTNNNMRFNNNGNSKLFSCYASGQSDIYLFVKDNDSHYEFYKDIAKFTTPEGDDPVNGWNFIALPVTGSIAPDATMTSNTYDLYQLNNTKWENYKVGDGNNANPGFSLVNGRGYLYANSANTTLHFSGAINTFTTEGNANQKELTTGWNLIGNPYNVPIYINKPYYKMNAARTAVESVSEYWSNTIPACTGVVVKATGDSEKVTFTTSAPDHSTGNQGNIQLALAQTVTNRGTASTIDNAIVSFSEGSKLEKFYFGEQDANLYIPQGTEEYAIVSSNGQGEMPVNFRANANGQYTLTVNPEGVELSYLHLIDNMTGADVDLLATPSYTFNAKTTDYESRFKLVFVSSICGDANGDNETFAFFSNGSWVIANEGQATLQVVDITGRIISSEVINGTCSKAVSATPGVYVLRLINGDSVKSQKIVVR